ncbi:MAG: MauE/DoxX family redox-associated membrane protein [Verrucomicrobiota bacterium]
MNTPSSAANCKAQGVVTLLARLALGALFVYMGLHKALEPVDFLKLVHQYDLVNNYWLLNAIAAALPWFETFCGLLLLGGIAVRGSALMLILMLVPFTWIVFQRALSQQAALHIPFCAVKFDCGCGNGEVFICRKLLENLSLLALSVWLLVGGERKFSVRRIWGSAGSSP